MKKFAFLCALVLSTAVLAEETQPHHIITVGADGFGWNGVGITFDRDKEKSGVDEHEAGGSNLQLNYSYVFNNRIMVGVELASETQTTDIKYEDGTKSESESNETSYGLSVGYNFNDDLSRSWWIKASLGAGNSESETKDEDGTSKSDYDYNYVGFGGGKRFSLESWGLKNVSYNPSISFNSVSFSGDAKDVGLDGMTQATLEIIKIDILF